MKKTSFPTPQDAEKAFYEAFEACSLNAMMAIWAEDEEILCIHPTGSRLCGYNAIKEGWQQIFESGVQLRFHLLNQQFLRGMSLSVQSVMEHIFVGEENAPRPPIIATHVFMLTASGWRMVVRHASLSPEASMKLAEIQTGTLH